MLYLNPVNYSINIKPSNNIKKQNAKCSSESLINEPKPFISLYNSKNLSFSSWNKISTVKTLNGDNYKCSHLTFFFRDFYTLEFLKKYLNKEFPNGTHILNAACSNGEETLSAAMILNDPKYKITAIDISEEAIDLAKKGEYSLNFYQFGPCLSDEHLIERKLYENELRNESDAAIIEGYWKKFDTHFVYTGDTQKFDNLLKETVTAKCFKAIHEKFDDVIIGFKVGDIRDFNTIKELKDKNNNQLETGVVIFKNAWYHLRQGKKGMKDVKTVAKNIYEILPQNGLLVCGSLFDDHFLKTEEKLSRTIDNSIFHNILRDIGFEPVFYDRAQLGRGIHYMVPSIWKKK